MSGDDRWVAALRDEVADAAYVNRLQDRCAKAEAERDELRTIVNGMADATRQVVAHFIQESRIKSMEKEIFALNDGLRGWKAVAKAAEEKAEKLAKFEAIVSETSDVVDEFDRCLEGTLAERVRKAIYEAGR